MLSRQLPKHRKFMGEMGALDGDTALGVSEEVRDPANSKALRKKEEDVDEGKAWEAPSSV